MHIDQAIAKVLPLVLLTFVGCNTERPTTGRSAPAAVPPACRPAPPPAPPTPFSETAIAEHREWLAGLGPASAIPPSPAPGELGPLLHAPSSEREELTLMEFFTLYRDDELPPTSETKPIPVEVHDLWLRREPVGKVMPDGAIELRWETIRPLSHGRISVGMHFFAERTRTTVYRKTKAYRAETPTLTHQAVHPTAWAIKPIYDEAGAARRGRGELTFRVVMHDDAHGKAPIHDGELAFRCEPVPCGAEARFVQVPAFRLGPVVDRVTPTSAVISFQTDTPTRAAVVVAGRDGIKRFPGATPGIDHEIAVNGLAPAQSYRYLVGVTDHRGESSWFPHGTFTTAPRGDAAFTFAFMSDSRRSPGGGLSDYRGVNRVILERLLAAAVARRVAFIIVVGDLIDGATTVPAAYRYQLDGWRQVTTPFGASTPIYETMGNHEILAEAWLPGWHADKRGESNSQTLFAEAFVNPDNGPRAASADAPSYEETVYSFDYGTAHLAVVNSDYHQRSHPDRTDHPAAGRGYRQGWVDDRQLAWLKTDLAGARAAGSRHLFVLTHEPAFPNGGHADDAMYWDGVVPAVLSQRDAFWQILSDAGVRAGLFGDEHNYSRMLIDEKINPSFGTPVWSFVSGGGGAPHYAQDKTLPWSDRVTAFSAHPHLVFFTVCGERVFFEAVSVAGVTLDSGELGR